LGIEPSTIYITRNSRRFAPIFYLNCEHVLFVYILKQRRKKIADFQEFKFFTKLKTLKANFLRCLSFINLPCGHMMSHKNLGPIGSAVFTFIGYKQTDTQTDKPNLYIDRI